MSKVTSKLQVTIPKALAERYGINPGDEIDWLPAGESIRVLPVRRVPAMSVAERLKSFDDETRRIARLQAGWPPAEPPSSRGWTREELYERGRAR